MDVVGLIVEMALTPSELTDKTDCHGNRWKFYCI